jgi:hypothetical protein
LPSRIWNPADLGSVEANQSRLMDCINVDVMPERRSHYFHRDHTGIYTTFLDLKHNKLKINFAPSPAGEGWGEENKSTSYIPPYPSLLPQGRRSRHLCRYLCPEGEGEKAAICARVEYKYRCGDCGNDINHREHKEHEVFEASFLRGLRDLGNCSMRCSTSRIRAVVRG